MKTGIIIIDPGHGGMVNVGDADANHAVSALENLGKKISLYISIFRTDELKLKKYQVYSTWNSIFIYSLKKQKCFNCLKNMSFSDPINLLF